MELVAYTAVYHVHVKKVKGVDPKFLMQFNLDVA